MAEMNKLKAEINVCLLFSFIPLFAVGKRAKGLLFFFFLSSALGSRWPSIGRTCENVDFPACLERACFDFKGKGGGKLIPSAA